MTNVRNIYTSCSCNNSPHCLDWEESGLIAYGTCNAIALYDVEKQVVVQMLLEHQKPVNSVRWIRSANEKYDDKLISCSEEKAVVWNKASGVYKPFSYSIPDVKTTYTIADAIHYQDQNNERKLMVAMADCDRRITVFENISHSYESSTNVKQMINFSYGLALDVKFCILSSKFPVLAVGSSECVISLFTQQANGLFSCTCLLTGHEDWIRGLDFFSDGSEITFLASCSQDCLIRIWKIANIPSETDTGSLDLIKLKEIIFPCYWNEGKTNFIVTLESVCEGHENWIYSVHWQPSNKMALNTPAKLLSASIDKTLIVWEFNELSGLWLEKARVGDVGGNTLGFYGGVFSPTGLSILGHSYQGALHLWHYKEELGAWEAGFAVTGHFSEVEDIVWEEQGTYLLSCSADQTVRLHAPYKQNCNTEVWNEVARPQVHGYDINCLAMINRCKFVSGGDEKVLRVFEATKNFVANMQMICKINITMDKTACIAEGATIAPLGLSNKAVFEIDLISNAENDQKHPKDRYPDSYFVPIVTHQPPSEDILLQNTLWPEVQKLYGHGYEIYAVACNHTGTLIASACKANKADHAGIILWDSKSWKQIDHLHSHSLTVTQMAFSPNDVFLLSVSRDRTWALFKKNSEILYERIAFSNKATGIHSRIIWSCSWSHDSKYFTTGSRDKTVIIWGSKNKDSEAQSSTGNWTACTVPFVMQDAVTAVDFAPTFAVNKRYLIAVGLEKGEVHIFTWEEVTGQLADWQIFAVLESNIAHHKTVRRLRFCPLFSYMESEHNKQLKLASCSYDHSVKIFTLYV